LRKLAPPKALKTEAMVEEPVLDTSNNVEVENALVEEEIRKAEVVLYVEDASESESAA
jgi:hypothetical protein